MRCVHCEEVAGPSCPGDGGGSEREVKIEENTERGVLERLRAERESIFKCMRSCSL